MIDHVTDMINYYNNNFSKEKIKELMVIISRRNRSKSEGYSISLGNGFVQSDLAFIIKKVFDIDCKNKEITFKLLHNEIPFLVKGHINKSRKDFYVSNDEWLVNSSIKFELGETVKLKLIDII